jgi:predicted permease
LNFFFRRRRDRELGNELRAHIEERVDDLMDEGMDEGSARRRAAREFGNSAAIREVVFEANGFRILDSFGQDLKIAVRTLVRRPAFSLGTALTLGLGIGATTCIYAIVNGVMLRQLPYTDSSRLVTIGSVSPLSALVAPGVQDLGPMSILYYQQLRARARSFETLAAVDTARLMPLATENGGELNVPAREISPQLLEMLDAKIPAVGRAFLSEEYGTGDEGAVMVTWEEWQRRYGGDPDLIGRTIGRIRGGRVSAVVIGVLPKGFRPLEAFFAAGERPGYYFPERPEALPEDRGWERWYVLGRLRPEVTVEQARGEVERIAADVAREFPDAPGSRTFEGYQYRLGLNGLHAQTIGASGRVLGLFFGAAAVLLILSSMNAATLFLARSLDRMREFGVRIALGAGRSRVIRLILTESAMLAVAGGVLGLLLAYAGVSLFLRYAPPSLPRLNAVVFDVHAVAVALAATSAAALVAGLVPAIRLMFGQTSERHDFRRSLSEPPSRLRPLLVGGQLTLAIVLLSGAALLFNSFVRIRSVDPGFKPDGLIRIAVPYKDARLVAGLEMGQAWDRIMDVFRSVPGVESVAGTVRVPFQTPGLRVRAQLPSGKPDAWHEGVAAYVITTNYLDTIGARVVRGRDFERTDGRRNALVGLVNESFVRSEFRGRDPVGERLRIFGYSSEIRVVGVVKDMIQARAEDGARPAIYLPYAQATPSTYIEVVVRTSLEPAAILPDLRARFKERFPDREPDIVTMPSLIASAQTDPRFRTLLIFVFAAVATILAAVGLHGSLAHFVVQRRRELAIRMALGADRKELIQAVLGRGMRLVLGSVVAGMIATLFMTRILVGFLYDVEPNDPVTLIATCAVLVLTSMLASLGPALRATTVNPQAVLKAD